jgi:hypothetical protein
MRKLILIAAFVLASATAQAGGTRGLALASGDGPAAATQPNAAEAPKSVSRPSAVNLPQQPQADEARSGAYRNSPMRRTERPHRRHGLILARLVYELHRHGIYW